STYLGGSTDDEATSITLDSANRAYITGLTSSTNFPVTPEAIQGALAGGSPPFDAFVTVLASNGSKLGFSTYLGGSGFEDGDDIAVDRHGNIALVGTRTWSDFPVTGGAFDTACGTDGTCNGGASDMFVLKIAHTPSLQAAPPGLAFAPQTVSTTSPPQIVNVS